MKSSMEERQEGESHFYHFSPNIGTFHKDGVCAVYNRFLLRPVFLSNNDYKDLSDNISDGIHEQSTLWKESSEFFKNLLENKIISKGISEEKSLLVNARRKIRYPFPHLLYLVVTDKCNMGCDYCFVRQNRTPDYHESLMSDSIAKKAIDHFIMEVSAGSKEDFEDEK